MKAPAILQSFEQNILQGATITSSVAPMASYDVETLGFLRPDWLVRFNTNTVNIRWTLASGSPGTPEQGDILIIPNSNIATGAATWVSSGGLSQALTFPALLPNGIPPSMVRDLTVDDPYDSDRQGHWWELQIVNNPVDVILGGAVALYSPKRYLVDRDFKWDYTIRETGGVIEVGPNDFMTRYIQDTLTYERELELIAGATTEDADRLQAWFQGNRGRGQPGLLWFDSDIEDGFLGILQRTFERVVNMRNETDPLASLETIRIVFTELSKGIPL
jgi:hypothetical protein